MKKLLTLLFIVISTIGMAQNNTHYSTSVQDISTPSCPPEGKSPNPSIRALNILKNRDVDIDTTGAKIITMDELLAPGDDKNRFSDSDIVCLIAVVIDFKDGGSETCNCKSKDKNTFDIHVVLGKTLDAPKNQIVVMELTKKFREKFGLDMNYGKTLKGHTIKIYGYMLNDVEHFQNAQNTNPTGTDIWRGTTWEVGHPPVYIIILN
jgi:hypothetical protein